jgi:hypothetical protein
VPTLLLTGVSGGALLLGALAVSNPVRLGDEHAEYKVRVSAPGWEASALDQSDHPAPPRGQWPQVLLEQSGSPSTEPSGKAVAEHAATGSLMHVPTGDLPRWRTVGGSRTAVPTAPTPTTTPPSVAAGAPDGGRLGDPYAVPETPADTDPDLPSSDAGLSAGSELLPGPTDGTTEGDEQATEPGAPGGTTPSADETDGTDGERSADGQAGDAADSPTERPTEQPTGQPTPQSSGRSPAQPSIQTTIRRTTIQQLSVQAAADRSAEPAGQPVVRPSTEPTTTEPTTTEPAARHSSRRRSAASQAVAEVTSSARRTSGLSRVRTVVQRSDCDSSRGRFAQRGAEGAEARSSRSSAPTWRARRS